jgi:hypothetical protein
MEIINLSKTEIALGILFAFFLFKIIKEISYILLYAFIIKLKSEGKLIPENDPLKLAEKVEKQLKENSTKFI